MSDAEDLDYEVIEVKVSKKIAITLSSGDVLALLQKRADAAESSAAELPAQSAGQSGRPAGFGQRLIDALFGRSRPPQKPG